MHHAWFLSSFNGKDSAIYNMCELSQDDYVIRMKFGKRWVEWITKLYEGFDGFNRSWVLSSQIQRGEQRAREIRNQAPWTNSLLKSPYIRDSLYRRFCNQIWLLECIAAVAINIDNHCLLRNRWLNIRKAWWTTVPLCVFDSGCVRFTSVFKNNLLHSQMNPLTGHDRWGISYIHDDFGDFILTTLYSPVRRTVVTLPSVKVAVLLFVVICD